jgi:integrase
MARKRSNGEGSIWLNQGRQRWEAVLITGHHPDGRLIRKTLTAKTRREVAAKLDAARAALDQGLAIPDHRSTVADYTTYWLAEVMPSEGLAGKTEEFYRQVVADYVLPHVGTRTLTGPRALTPADVENMAAALERAGYSHRTATAARTTLSKVLRSAEQRGLVGRNVARLARPPKNRGKARAVKALTVAEIGALLDVLDGTPWHPIVVVGATTGLRPGELLALHWPDVTLDGDPHVSVRHALTYPTGVVALKAPKRDRSYRTVPLVPEAVTALRAWRKVQATERLAAGELWSTDWPGLVFTNPDGRPRRVDVFGHTLRRALPGAHPHRLRHSYATHLLEAGSPIHHVAELLGDSVSTVEAAYSHVLRAKHETAALAAGLLGGRS